MGVLFQKSLLERYVESCLDNRPDETPIIKIIEKWVGFFADKSKLKESNLEQSFNEDIFVNLLGYTMPPYEYFNFLPKQKTHELAGFPDFLIGNFRLKAGKLEEDIRRAVGELKSPERGLDQIDSSRKKTPVEQAFEYAKTNGIYVDWVIVSNLRRIRLYRNTSMWDYEEFNFKNFLENGCLTSEFWKFYFLLHYNYFLKNSPKTDVSNLLLENIEKRVKLTDSFYGHYREILLDTYHELAKVHNTFATQREGQIILAQAAEKFLHRGLLVCFMSDHPQRLLKKGILDEIIDKATNFPTLKQNKIYATLKDFFQCVNEGSPKYYPFEVFGYDGSLFKKDDVLDKVELTDQLFLKKYDLNGKELIGVYGFRAIDFYYEFSPHLLGRLFEYSINDQEKLFNAVAIQGKDILESFSLQSELGIVYTRETLANFAAGNVLHDLFGDIKSDILKNNFSNKALPDLNEDEEIIFWKQYMDKLLSIRIIDIAVGSGAFLVACYNILKNELNIAFELQKGKMTGLKKYLATWEQSLLEESLYGKDIMSDAISVAKLALWLASIHKDIPLKDFHKNFVIGDSLDIPVDFPSNLEKNDNYQQFDIVIGNPPWGAEVSKEALNYLSDEMTEVEKIDGLDSFELFLHTAIRYLKKGGRLCYILPHTLLYPEKESTRKYLVNNFKIERWHYLGSDWFGSKIRMNTTLLQLKKEEPKKDNQFLSMTLVDDDRKAAIAGRLDLKQLEKSYAFGIPQYRSQASANSSVELFRYASDDPILEKMEKISVSLGQVCDRGRGVEINKAGDILQCPSCGKWTPPPAPEQGVSIELQKKKCNHCGHEFLTKEALANTSIVAEEGKYDALYIDGDSFSGRYQELKYRSLRLGYDGIDYKSPELYLKTKLFIRQAGVGLVVAYDGKGAYCPQSVYVYRLKENAQQESQTNDKNTEKNHLYSQFVEHKFLYALLQSRVLAYYVFKRFGEIDASQAFSKLTHVRLAVLPIPVLDCDKPEWLERQRKIVSLVDKMLNGEVNGSATDWEIERLIHECYGLVPQESAYINSQLGLVAYHQAMKQMFPENPPPKPVFVREIKVKQE